MNSALNLRTARSLASEANSAWSEVFSHEDNSIVVFRHGDDSSEVRRLVVDYDNAVLYASVRSNMCKNATALFSRADSDVVLLGRFFETPHLYDCLGFKPCQLKAPCPLPAEVPAVKKGEDAGCGPKPPASLAPVAVPSVRKEKRKCCASKPPAAAPLVKKEKPKACGPKPPAASSVKNRNRKCCASKPPDSVAPASAPSVRKERRKPSKAKPPASLAPAAVPRMKKAKCKVSAPSPPSICVTYPSEVGGPPPCVAPSSAPSSAPSVKSVKKEKREAGKAKPPASLAPAAAPRVKKEKRKFCSSKLPASLAPVAPPSPKKEPKPPVSVALPSSSASAASAPSICLSYRSEVGGPPPSVAPSSAPSSAPSVKKEKRKAVDLKPADSHVPSAAPSIELTDALEVDASVAPSSAPPSSLTEEVPVSAAPSSSSSDEGCDSGESVCAVSEGKSLSVIFSEAVPVNSECPVSSKCPSTCGGGEAEAGRKQCNSGDSKPPLPQVPPPRGANIFKSEDRNKAKEALSDFDCGVTETSNNGGGHSWIRSLVDKTVRKELRKIDLAELKCFALTPDGKGIVYAEEDGVCYWNSEIGSDLAEELNSSTMDRYPIAINMGTDERYFVKYSDGEVAVDGDTKLVDIVKKGGVKMVAFGKEFDSFAVVHEDGRTDCINVPKGLQRILEKCDEGTKVEFVSMGVDGEYFVRQSKEKKNTDGKGSSVETMVLYGNIHSDELFNALKKCPRDIGQLAFGPSGSFVATD